MEIVALVEAGYTARNILCDIVDLIKEIQRAREDVRSLPADIARLLKVVDELSPRIKKIQAQEAKVPDQEILFSLQRLRAELAAALVLVDEYEKKEQRKKERPDREVLKVAKALVGQGAAKQKKEIGAICKAIASEEEKLDKALMSATYVITVENYATGQSTHSIVEDTAGAVDRIERSWKTFLAEGDERGSLIPSAIVEASIVADLDHWAKECLGNESFQVSLLIAGGQSNVFYSPTFKYEDDSDAHPQSEATRGAREAGLDVENYTKVQFHIKVQDECYLYVISFDKGLPTATNVELIFPKHRRSQNKITSERTRKFPDRNRHKQDPLAVKLEKNASLKDGVQGQVLLYLVLSNQPLTPKDGSDLDKETLEQLAINLKSKDASEGIYVERFLFDVL